MTCHKLQHFITDDYFFTDLLNLSIKFLVVDIKSVPFTIVVGMRLTSKVERKTLNNVYAALLASLSTGPPVFMRAQFSFTFLDYYS